MLAIKFIRENPDVVKADLKKRQDDEKIPWVDKLLKLDEQWRKKKVSVDNLRHDRNKVTLEISKAKKMGRDASDLFLKAKEIPQKIAEVEEEMKELKEKIDYYLYRIPNILDPSVPVGEDEADNVEIKTWGELKPNKFPLKSHGELIEDLGIADFKRATKVSGAGFVYLKGDLVLLDLALQRFAIDHLLKKGYTLIEPPFLMNKEAYKGVTSLDDFETVMYKIEGDDMYMIATAEHPLVAMHKDETFDNLDKPIKYVGISPCFRREIGSHGLDSKGLFRMHQFNKVEQVVFCKPDQSWELFEELQRNTEELFEALKLPFRVVNICTGDIGILAAKKYDIEAYFPREEGYKEVTSCSNDTSYQAVRLNIRYKVGEEKEYVHTLNNTGIATSRAMRAILEVYQQKDGTVVIPKVLRPYMLDKEKIVPQ